MVLCHWLSGHRSMREREWSHSLVPQPATPSCGTICGNEGRTRLLQGSGDPVRPLEAQSNGSLREVVSLHYSHFPEGQWALGCCCRPHRRRRSVALQTSPNQRGKSSLIQVITYHVTTTGRMGLAWKRVTNGSWRSYIPLMQNKVSGLHVSA